MADVIEVDHGYRNVMEALAKLEDLTVEVGIYGKEAKALNRGTPVAKYAGVHEADTAWMRDTWDENERAHDQMIEALRDRVLRGEDPIELMRQMGEYHKRKFQEKIKRLGLWGEGMMHDSLAVRVRDKEARERARQARFERIRRQKRDEKGWFTK